MPYEGDSPTEAWQYWFDEPPSNEVCLSLIQGCKQHSIADVLEAIAVAGMKFPMLENNEQRVKYMRAVLRRKALERVAPELAEEERQADNVCWYWRRKEISEWPLYRNKVRAWLRYVDAEGIKAVIHISKSWRDFHDKMDEILAQHPQVIAEARAAEEAARAEEAAIAAKKLMVVPRRRRRQR
jgi:hypothetical protein